MKRSVAEGIQRRLDGTDQLHHDGTYCWLDEILAANGLPLINSHAGGFDPDYRFSVRRGRAAGTDHRRHQRR